MGRTSTFGSAVVAMAHLVCVAVEAGGQGLPSPVLRSTDEALQQALAIGAERSAQFRVLAEEVGEDGGIVQIEPGRCGARRACLLHWIVAAGSVRFLRIQVDAHLGQDERIALVGHELQHAVEVLSDPAIDTPEEIYWRFRGVAANRAFETDAALEAEARIRSELKRTAPRKVRH